MKKIIFLIILLITVITPVAASTTSAYAYIIMDLDSGRVIESKNKDSPQLIASITKIMTCIIALEYKNPSDIVTVDETVNKSYGSGIYIKPGEKISLHDLLYGLMLRSGNDAAIMISNFVAGSEEAFVKIMNKKAHDIGMKNTIFYNSSGLDNDKIGNKSTVFDMALLTRYAMRNEMYRQIVATKKHTVKTNLNTYIWHNKNKLLKYDYITGGKTGYTLKAKRTLVSTANKNDMNLAVVTIKDSDDWNTHLELYKKVFNNYRSYKVLSKRNFKVPGDKYYDELYIKDNVYITLKKDETKSVVTKIKLHKIKDYQNNDKVGVGYVYLNNELLTKVDIYAKKNISIKNTLINKIKHIFRKRNDNI